MQRILLPLILVCASAVAQTPPPRGEFLLRIEPVRKDFSVYTMTEAERPILGQHVAYLNSLLAAGTLTFAGQAFDPKGLFGIIVVKAADSDAASAILNGDPTIKNKLFRGEVIPFHTVFERRCPPAGPPAH
jgi:uncharacterized protein YciI